MFETVNVYESVLMRTDESVGIKIIFVNLYEHVSILTNDLNESERICTTVRVCESS